MDYVGTKSEHLEKKEKWTFEGESFEESLLIFGRMLADEVRRSGLRAYLPRGYILVSYSVMNYHCIGPLDDRVMRVLWQRHQW